MEFLLVKFSCLRGGSRKCLITVVDNIGNGISSVTLRIPYFFESCLRSFTSKLMQLDRRQKNSVNQKIRLFLRTELTQIPVEQICFSISDIAIRSNSWDDLYGNLVPC